MASSYSAWAESPSFMHLSYLNTQDNPAMGNIDPSLPSADPTHLQPFTTSKNVSYLVPGPDPVQAQAQAHAHHHPRAVNSMAKKRHYSQRGAVATSLPLKDMSHGLHASAHPEFPCSTVEHCHFSPPCDLPDCDESTKCYDHAAHDRFPCVNDPSWCQDHFKCDDVFPCDPAACDFDFGNCNFLPCPEICIDGDCHLPQHAQDCSSTTACPTVECSDPQCSEGVLYCCLSDICPHKTHADCHQPNLPVCQEQHDHCNISLPIACHAPCHLTVGASCPPPLLPDHASVSTIGTPQTDLSDTLQTPTSLQFQSLVEAATTQASLNALETRGWEAPSFDDSLAPQRKRRKVQNRSNEQKLYEASVMDQTFMKPEQGLRDGWQDYSYQYNPDFVFAAPQQPFVSTSSQQPSTHVKASSQSPNSVPPEGLICKWHDETTGTCNATFTSSEDFHNHVKEHTSALVGSSNTTTTRGAPSRTYKCRWLNCDKTDPFGTKNHLDRHMQNHTHFKPFACTICGHRCVTHQQLTNHTTTHTRSKPFVCDHPGCEKSFSVKTALSTHKRTHTNDKPFGCRFCGDRYADSSNLSKHRKTVHEDQRTSIPCPEEGCEYRDSRCQRLERHCRDKGHGAALIGDPMKWAEYTGRWKRKTAVGGRSRAGSVAGSSVVSGVCG